MKYYPTGWKDPAHHLLFDIGFSYALLRRTEDFLSSLVPHQSLSIEDWATIQELTEQIAEFHRERLQTIDEVYNAAHDIKLPEKKTT